MRPLAPKLPNRKKHLLESIGLPVTSRLWELDDYCIQTVTPGRCGPSSLVSRLSPAEERTILAELSIWTRILEPGH